MKILKLIFSSLIILGLFTISNAATTYYINDAATGDDTWTFVAGSNTTGDGSISKPYLTFAKLTTDNTLAAGDVVRIDGGTHSWSDNIVPDASGSSGNEITIEGVSEAATVVTTSGANTLRPTNFDYFIVKNITLANTNNASPIYIESTTTNWTFTNVSATHTTGQRTVEMQDGSGNNNHTFTNCTFINTSSEPSVRVGQTNDAVTFTGCTFTSSATRTFLGSGAATNISVSSSTITNSNSTGDAIYLDANHNGYTFDGNTITATGSDGSGAFIADDGATGITFTDNTIDIQGAGTNAHGMELQGSQGTVNILRNKFMGGDDCFLFPAAATTAVNFHNNSLSNCVTGMRVPSNAVIANIYNNSVYTTGSCFESSQMAGINLKNNILYTTSNSTSQYCINCTNSSSRPATSDYNMYYHPNDAQCANDGTVRAALTDWANVYSSNDANSIEGDPLYMGAGNDNLSVHLSSGAKDEGVTGLVTDDILEAVRENPPFIGAFEGDAGSVLPVELISFNGFSEQGTHLTWTTASEVNNNHFIIQYSLNGVDFEVIGMRAGNGTTSFRSEYTFYDDAHTEGYYRLEQIDYDNGRQHSDILFVSKHGNRMLTKNAVSLHVKNSGLLEIQLDQPGSDYIILELYDGLGRIVESKKLNADLSTFFVDVNSYRNQWLIANVTQGSMTAIKKIWVGY